MTINWTSTTWGGHVTVAANGSHVPDAHVDADDELDGAL
jgi:hypothetical protein